MIIFLVVFVFFAGGVVGFILGQIYSVIKQIQQEEERENPIGY
jgi:hypothetical protein